MKKTRPRRSGGATGARGPIIKLSTTKGITVLSPTKGYGRGRGQDSIRNSGGQVSLGPQRVLRYVASPHQPRCCRNKPALYNTGVGAVARSRGCQSTRPPYFSDKEATS